MTTIKNSPHETISQFLIKTIRERIILGVINTKEPIDQCALADEFNISKSPIRDALLHLQGEGFVTFAPRKSVSIATVSSEHITEIYRLKQLLENDLLEQSCSSSNSEALSKATKLLAQLKNSHCVNHWYRFQSEFFTCLYSTSKSSQTQEMINLLNVKIQYFEKSLYPKLCEKIDLYAYYHSLLTYCSEGKTELAKTTLTSYMEQISAFFIKENKNCLL